MPRMATVMACVGLVLLPGALDAKPQPSDAPALSRTEFNRLAASAGYPLVWRADSANPGQLDADELVVTGGWTGRERWVRDGELTPAARGAWDALVELRRLEAVRRELDQGRPTLVETSFVDASDEDRALMKHFARVAEQIDALYEVQLGSDRLRSRIAKTDAASRALFARNQGPWCEGPETEADPFCNAIAGFPARDGGFSYPPGATIDVAFCETLAQQPNAEALLSPFTVVRQGKGDADFKAIPYHDAYKTHVRAIAKELRAAADAVRSADEAPLQAYLRAAAAAFENDDWESADEAWSAMAGSSSRWYIRVGPDETYWEPCQVKAGYHLSLALLDPSALAWKQKLEPLKRDMEERLSTLVGPDIYAARDVGFELPEFIRVVINAGDSRSAFGATVGQSLPNFGRVARESRGRTVVMVNLYTDVDSMADGAAKDALLLDKAALAHRDPGQEASRFGILLHEAMHNFGPGSATLVDGKESEAIFGGPLAAILEELKAELGAIYFLPYLRDKGIITDQEVAQGYIAVLSWAAGHLSRGLFTATGRPKTYSHVAAVIVGSLLESGAIEWDGTLGADTSDAGRFRVHIDKIAPVAEALTREVIRIKAIGDLAAGKALDEHHTSDAALVTLHWKEIADRVLRFPKASFVYATQR